MQPPIFFWQARY